MAPSLITPTFLIAPPRSGEEALFEALARGSSIWRSVPLSASFLDGDPEFEAATVDHESHRLTGADAPAFAELAHSRLGASLRDLEGEAITDVEPEGDVRVLAQGPRLALRVGFLAAAFPDARFVYIHRDPAQSIAEMLAAWRSEEFISAPDLPGWDGPPWSLPLIPGWRELSERSLEEIVAQQWRAITATALDDLESVDPERWAIADFAALIAEPRQELRRLCGFLDLPYDQAMLTPLEIARRVLEQGPPEPTVELARALPVTDQTAARARDLLAGPTPQSAPARSPGAAFSSVSTGSFTRALAKLNSSLLVSTYQSGKLICARDQGGLLNTHLRDFDKPMGIAVRDGGFALATRTEVWDFQNMPDVAPKVEPAGTHDACYLPFNRHTTGDMLAHELAYAGGELWVTSTAFSCLATFDAAHSFLPRWKPPFISELAPGDRCHLNGMAVIDGRVAYVSALGQTDEPAGWREGKADGGCVIDVATSEIVATGLSMPHSPRWHQDRLWVLESGRGELALVNLEGGDTEPVIELPGFTRGLAFAGDIAFVGLSQIRESSTFGDLPLTQRLDERVCGVWMVDIKKREIVGFLRFEDLVQEIFDVGLLPGVRYPEIAEPGSTAVSTSFVLP